MSTVDKGIADQIVAGGYASDRPVKIVRYRNMFDGGFAYGVVFERDDLMKYERSDACTDPQTYWMAGDLKARL